MSGEASTRATTRAEEEPRPEPGGASTNEVRRSGSISKPNRRAMPVVTPAWIISFALRAVSSSSASAGTALSFPDPEQRNEFVVVGGGDERIGVAVDRRVENRTAKSVAIGTEIGTAAGKAKPQRNPRTDRRCPAGLVPIGESRRNVVLIM